MNGYVVEGVCVMAMSSGCSAVRQKLVVLESVSRQKTLFDSNICMQVELLELPPKRENDKHASSVLRPSSSTPQWSRSNTKLASIPESASTSLMSASIQETSLSVNGVEPDQLQDKSSRKSSGISTSTAMLSN